jgi:acetyltransferase-like isoleucine patch superfamily enzyme
VETEHSAKTYEARVRSRGFIRFLIGLLPRFKKYIKCEFIVAIARSRGATVGHGVTMPLRMARRANMNLFVGDHVSIQTDRIDCRGKVVIGDYVIIGSDVEILTASHNIDSPEWEQKTYGIEIENYAWLATRTFVLPSCRRIGRGSVCAAGSLIAQNVPAMAVVVGNPAQVLRQRKSIHSELCVESQLGNDLLAYVHAYKGK